MAAASWRGSGRQATHKIMATKNVCIALHAWVAPISEFFNKHIFFSQDRGRGVFTSAYFRAIALFLPLLLSLILNSFPSRSWICTFIGLTWTPLEERRRKGRRNLLLLLHLQGLVSTPNWRASDLGDSQGSPFQPFRHDLQMMPRWLFADHRII